MKLIEIRDWQAGSGRIYTLEDVLSGLLDAYPGQGRIEQIEAELEILRSFVLRLLVLNVKTVEELNTIIGYERFKEVKDPTNPNLNRQ